MTPKVQVEVAAPSHTEQLAGPINPNELTEMLDYLRSRHEEPNMVVTRDVEAANVFNRMYPASPVRRSTMLLLQGVNDLTGRPIRVYITPTDQLICVETLGQLGQ
jgi:hypothetical protein